MPATSPTYDAVVVGAGPNGLAAAIVLAQAGRRVLVREAMPTIGGGSRTAELTMPGFRHDVCSSIHPLANISPFFRTLPLAEHGLEYINPPSACAHPLDDGTAVMAERTLEATVAQLGRDGPAYRRLFGHLVDHWQEYIPDLMGPLPLPPRRPLLLARFGLRALWPLPVLAAALFSEQRAPALLAGMAAHSLLPLGSWLTAAFAIMVGGSAHMVGWPMARGGSQAIVDALASYLRSLGGEIVTGQPVERLEELPAARHVLLDVGPAQIARMAQRQLPANYLGALRRYRYGVGAFKIDLALDGPIPWKAADCARAAVVHVGGTLPEVAASEAANWRGQPSERPYVLVAQTTLFDPTRAPAGKHTVWAYCHVPPGCPVDMTGRIESQIERFAPGFRDRIIARATRSPADLERYNPNYVGGDLNAGVQDWRQFYFRPVIGRRPYATPNPRLYICSSATPPGGGVHGMCGYHAARLLLARDRAGKREK